jgi:hypothetical protein
MHTTKLKPNVNLNNSHNILHKWQPWVLKPPKTEIVTENAIRVPVGKGQKIAVIKTETDVEKVQAFLAVNHFPTLPKDPTDKYQKPIHKTLQQRRYN